MDPRISDKSNYPFAKHDDHVSVSKIKTLMMCPRKYMFSYKYKLQEEKQFYLTRGIIFHNILADFIVNRDKDKNVYYEKIATAFAEAKANGQAVSNAKTSEDTVMNSVISAFDQFYTFVTKINKFKLLKFNDGVHGERPAIELGFRIPFVNIKTMEPLPNVNFDLFGFIDQISFDSINGLSVRDHKLHGRKYTDFFLKTDIQLKLYAYVFKYLLKMGCFPEIKEDKIPEIINVGFNSFLLSRTGKVELSSVNTEVSDDEINATVNLVADMIHNEATMKFTPCFGDHCNYMCSFQEPCLILSNGGDFGKYLAEQNEKNDKIIQDLEDEEELF